MLASPDPNKPAPLIETPSALGRRREESRSQSAPASAALLLIAGLLIPCLLAYGFAVQNEIQVTGVVLVILGMAVILARPFWGLIFFLGLLYIRPEESVPALAGMHFTLTVAVVTLVGMLCQMALDRSEARRTPLNGMILGLGAAAVLSAAPTGDVMPAVLDMGRLVILVILMLNLVRAPDRYQTLVTAILVLTGYLAAYSVYLYSAGGGIHQDGIMRSQATGIFGDPNDLAATLVAGLALAAPRALHQAARARQIFYGLLALLLLGAILLTNSRGGMMALMVLFGAYFLASRLPRRKKLVWGVLGALLYLGAAGARMTSFDSQEASANSRFWFWDNGVTQFLGHPLTGIGYGQFPAVNYGMTAHNSFVLCFAELGLLGYFFWMGCLFYSLRRPPEDGGAGAPDGQQAVFGARTAMVTYLVASFWLSHTYTPILYVLMCLPVVAHVGAASGKRVPAGPPAPPPHTSCTRDRLQISALCVASIVFIKMLSDHYR